MGSDCKIAIGALGAFAVWLFVVLPLIYLPNDGAHGEFLGVKPGEWLMFFATIALVFATWWLVIRADRNAEKQLRAYVLVKATRVMSASAGGTMISQGGQPIVIQAGYQPMAIITYKNFGKTPAHDVEFFANVEIVPWPIRQKDLPDLDSGGTSEIIAPGDTATNMKFFRSTARSRRNNGRVSTTERMRSCFLERSDMWTPSANTELHAIVSSAAVGWACGASN
jgi:hypothetical protein